MDKDVVGLANDEIGINENEARKCVGLLAECVEEDNKIEGIIREVNEKIKSAYSSSNSGLLQKNNVNIANSLHTKARNIRSYKLYLEKYITEYTATSIDVENEVSTLSDELV